MSTKDDDSKDKKSFIEKEAEKLEKALEEIKSYQPSKTADVSKEDNDSKNNDSFAKTIAISAYSKNFEIKEYISPCGACRQVMAEYEEKQAQSIRILLHSPNNKVLIANSVEDLLPFIFRSPELKKY